MNLIYLQNVTAEALKESVYHDYKEFIHSTMEIQHLESEILEVKHHLADAEGLLRNMQVYSLLNIFTRLFNLVYNQ